VLLVLSAATLFAAPARNALDGGKAMNGVADFFSNAAGCSSRCTAERALKLRSRGGNKPQLENRAMLIIVIEVLENSRAKDSLWRSVQMKEP
jgi:hypothetical protein